MTARKTPPAAGLAGKLMLSGALILGSGAYAWWQHTEDDRPRLAATQLSAQPAKTAMTVSENRGYMAPPVPVQVAQDAAAEGAAHQAKLPPPPEQAKDAPTRPLDAPTSIDNTPPAQPAPQVAVASNIPPEAPPPPVQPPPSGRYANGDFTGPSTDTPWGTVQVVARIQNGAIAEIEPIDYPQHRRRSVQINEWALPVLEREVIQAQSANVDIVSQATTTSVGYLQSLAGALAQAKR